MSAIGIAHQLKALKRTSKLRAVHTNNDMPERAGEEKMTPTAEKGQETKRVQRTVFDLAAFDDVKLIKDVPVPSRPESLESALATVGTKERLLEIIHKGMVSDATSAAWDDISGFKIVGDDGEAGEDYSGKFADEEKGKLINAAVLSLAKMNGYDKSLTKEKKGELKEKAKKFLRDNPAMIEGMQG